MVRQMTEYSVVSEKSDLQRENSTMAWSSSHKTKKKNMGGEEGSAVIFACNQHLRSFVSFWTVSLMYNSALGLSRGYLFISYIYIYMWASELNTVKSSPRPHFIITGTLWSKLVWVCVICPRSPQWVSYRSGDLSESFGSLSSAL